VLSIVISTVAFFVASYSIKRWADDSDIPRDHAKHLHLHLAIALGMGRVGSGQGV